VRVASFPILSLSLEFTPAKDGGLKSLNVGPFLVQSRNDFTVFSKVLCSYSNEREEFPRPLRPGQYESNCASWNSKFLVVDWEWQSILERTQRQSRQPGPADMASR
jgi:hypothetical protein